MHTSARQGARKRVVTACRACTVQDGAIELTVPNHLASQPGAEICISYGVKDNRALMLAYGFVVPGNVEDRVPIERPKAGCVSSEGLVHILQLGTPLGAFTNSAPTVQQQRYWQCHPSVVMLTAPCFSLCDCYAIIQEYALLLAGTALSDCCAWASPPCCNLALTAVKKVHKSVGYKNLKETLINMTHDILLINKSIVVTYLSILH